MVDATQGVEAQSVANCYTATELGLEVVPVINKIDLPSADPPRVIKEIEEIIGIPAEDALMVSGKTGEGVEELIEQLIERIPQPKGDPDAPLQALIVDSWFDNYVGVVTLVRIFNGTLKVGDKIRVMSTGRTHQVDKMGRFTPKSVAAREFGPGDVGFVIAGIKEIDGAPGRRHHHARIQAGDGAAARLQAGPAARVRRHVPDRLRRLRQVPRCAVEAAAQRLGAALRTRSVHARSASASACGFLGLLHMDIVQERLEREYQIELITVAPTVIYEVKTTDGEVVVRRQPDQTTAGRPHR